MKLKFIFSVMLLVGLSGCHNSQDINIKVVDDDDVYKYTASFPRNKSRLVERYINNSIAPTSFSTDDVLEVTTTLDDQTKFEYESAPGKLRIELYKKENSPASYKRIKKMCESLNQVINPKK